MFVFILFCTVLPVRGMLELYVGIMKLWLECSSFFHVGGRLLGCGQVPRSWIPRLVFRRLFRFKVSSAEPSPVEAPVEAPENSLLEDREIAQPCANLTTSITRDVCCHRNFTTVRVNAKTTQRGKVEAENSKRYPPFARLIAETMLDGSIWWLRLVAEDP
ncbi:hypothetical protein BJ875DRAFT_20100 [Amylocarpus encephaloides]|uniref:Secreted protein n=1 Tax=Amylocarpus encephaloides TaxID=45428 RepID=A0A9P7YI32_9HELO|nr:hypothetical protein BJ875DRAFT_20100 [Amylocarpus encephaloides]